MTLATTIEYTPFVETSFGYGTTELNTWFTNADDIVKVRIVGFSGFDRTTGHISTPSVGTAVSTFNTHNYVWQVVGERDDVNQVLSQLKYFPQDDPNARTWSQPRTRDNVTSGAYGSTEEPPAIADVGFSIKVYDANDVLDGRAYNITASAINNTYGNQRPYWATEPTHQECSSLGIPPYINLGTISHGSDTENVNVKCEFRNYGSSSTYAGSAYGSFTRADRFYIGDKKEGDTNSSDARFNFTGSVSDAQAFLDNIGYQKYSTPNTFDMFLTIDDGVAASTVTKTCWFSNTPFTTSHALPDLVGTEETTITGLNQDASWTINYPDEVNQFYYVITLDATGTDGVTNMLSTIGAGTFSNGVYTSINCISPSALAMRMTTTQFLLRDDFDDDFTYTIQFFGTNTFVGSSYSSPTQTVNVSMTGTNEISNLSSSHSYTEDNRYDFADGTGLPNIAHGNNVQYTARITASDSNAISTIWTQASGYTAGTDFFWENGNQFRMVGTRDQVNEMLNGAYFEPTIDYDQNFTFTYKQTRLGGDTTSDEANGDYYNVEIGANNTISMTAIAHDEYSFTASSKDWTEDVSKIFDTGIRVTDLADEHEWRPEYQTDYTVSLKTVDAAGNDFTDGFLNASSISGSPIWTMTGSKTAINTALASMKYVPQIDGEDGFFIQFKIVRDFDSTVFVDYDQSRQITFNTPTTHPETTAVTSTVSSWNKNVNVEFDSGLRIRDLSSDNPDFPTLYNGDYRFEARVLTTNDNDYVEDGYSSDDYVSTIQSVFIHYGAQGALLTTANTSNLTSWSGTGTYGNPRVAVGTKTQINDVMANLKFVPPVDFTETLSDDGQFRVEYRLERVGDSTVYYDYTHHTQFSTGTDDGMYSTPSSNLSWTEDVASTHDTGLSILDMATENPEYTHHNGWYTVTGRAKNSNGDLDATHGAFTYLNYGTATVWGSGTVADPLTITGTKSDINTALDNLRFTPYPDVRDSFWFEWNIRRNHDSVILLNYSSSTTFDTAANTTDLNDNWGSNPQHTRRIDYVEDVPDQTLFSHLGDVVLDLSPNNHNDITYDLEIEFNTANQFRFDLSGHTGGNSITISGTKAQVNSLVPQISVSPVVPDLAIENFNDGWITATLTIYKNNVQVGQHTAGVAYLWEGDVAEATVSAYTQFATADTAVPITAGQTLTPAYLRNSYGPYYNRPFTINDLWESGGGASQYKVTFTTPSGITLYDTDGLITSDVIDWTSKTDIHNKIAFGIRARGVTGDFTLPFTIRRKTADAIELNIFSGTLNYHYLFEPELLVQTHTEDEIADSGNSYVTSRILNTTDTVYGILSPTLSRSTLISNISDDLPNNGDNNWFETGDGASINLLVDNGVCSSPTTMSAFYAVERITSTYDNSVTESGMWGNRGVKGLKVFPVKQYESGSTYTSATVSQETVTLETVWGTKVDYTIDFNWTWRHQAPALTQTLFPTGTDQELIKQSNYWDGTYMCVNNIAIDLNGNKLTVGDNRSNRYTAGNYFYDDSAYDRALVNAPQGYFFAFRAEEQSGDVKIICDAYSSPTGNLLSSSLVPDYTVKTGYNTYANGEEVYIQQVIYDSSNNDVYVLAMLETYNNTKHAIIAKLDYNGSTYTWTTVKDIQLLTSNEYLSVEAHLSQDLTRLVTIQQGYELSNGFPSGEFNNTARVRVYDKDNGGSNNWGLTTTTSANTKLTKKNKNWHDVNYCDINSTADILITRLGRIFKKDQGGTDNWGEYGFVEAITASIDEVWCKFTQDYLITVRTNDGQNTIDYFRLYDKDTLEELSSSARLKETSGTYFTRMVESSKEHNIVGLYLQGTGSDYDPENYTFQLYQLTT